MSVLVRRETICSIRGEAGADLGGQGSVGLAILFPPVIYSCRLATSDST